MALFSALTHQSGKLYRKLFPIPCLLCGLPGLQGPLCRACTAELPLLGPACQRCAMPLESAQICGRCLQHPPVAEHCLSLYRYQAGIKRCITSFKFHQQLQFADFFAAQMSHLLAPRKQLPDCLIPIPLHPLRLRQRGFNQAQEIARRLANSLDLSCQPELLQRIRYTRSQSQLSFKQRHHNVRQAFQCPDKAIPAHIAIIDDVMTSGHTTAEAAKVLQKNGADTIEVWTIARAISHY
ncbi:ComF family protein [Methylophaga sp.]|uniref:ComF family protein n=1 Tax=Methylophaga sp. TaxID=2024840 RepID=UPI001400A15D|nr:ComF family protein [Methylophaga sp.]MTI63227.1 ComF family protein [Methylophaga sp.]